MCRQVQEQVLCLEVQYGVRYRNRYSALLQYGVRDRYSVLQYGVRYGDRYSVELLTYGVRYRVDCLAGSNVCCGKYVDRVTLTCGLESGIST